MRPIGVGEVVRRIVGKSVVKVVKPDLLEAVGALQLCTGQDAGCESAVHAMKFIFEEDTTEAMIFIDAFNSLNRQVTLHNSQVVCPALAPILVNTYRNDALLVVDGHCMMSRESTTQGDPLAMAMYAIRTQPLIHHLSGIAKQVWYADDSAAGGGLANLRKWWDALEEFDPHYGYYPNGLKTHVVTKPGYVEIAKEIFWN